MEHTPVALIAAGLSAAVDDQFRLCCPGDPEYKPGMEKLELNQLHKSTLNWIDVPTDNAPAGPKMKGGFQILVITLTGTEIPVEVHSSFTILRVKEIIEMNSGIEVCMQRLILAGTQLQDHWTLSDCNCPKDARVHLVLRLRGGGYHIHALNSDFLDPDYDYDFTDVSPDEKSQSFYRGGKTYIRPYGWKRIAIKVRGKYEDDRWLGIKPGYRTGSCRGEWAVSYHGSGKAQVRDIAKDGFDLSKGQRFMYGRGIYSTPDPEVAAVYAKEFQFRKEKYQTIVQNRVDLAATEVVNDGKYYVTVAEKFIRPYGLLIRKM